jgi:hypothetical protein
MDSIKSKLGMNGNTQQSPPQQQQQQQAPPRQQAPPQPQYQNRQKNPGGTSQIPGTSWTPTQQPTPQPQYKQKFTGQNVKVYPKTTGHQLPPQAGSLKSVIKQKVGNWAHEEKQYWKGEAKEAGRAVVSAVKQSPRAIKHGIDSTLDNAFPWGGSNRQFDKNGNRIKSQRLAKLRTRVHDMDQRYEMGRRDMVNQMSVKSTHRMVNEVIGNPTPAPMWRRGRGTRSYTSTYKSRRQARSSAHRAKLQRGGGGFQF